VVSALLDAWAQVLQSNRCWILTGRMSAQAAKSKKQFSMRNCDLPMLSISVHLPVSLWTYGNRGAPPPGTSHRSLTHPFFLAPTCTRPASRTRFKPTHFLYSRPGLTPPQRRRAFLRLSRSETGHPPWFVSLFRSPLLSSLCSPLRTPFSHQHTPSCLTAPVIL
jgi:hypothetical protein